MHLAHRRMPLPHPDCNCHRLNSQHTPSSHAPPFRPAHHVQTAPFLPLIISASSAHLRFLPTFSIRVRVSEARMPTLSIRVRVSEAHILRPSLPGVKPHTPRVNPKGSQLHPRSRSLGDGSQATLPPSAPDDACAPPVLSAFCPCAAMWAS